MAYGARRRRRQGVENGARQLSVVCVTLDVADIIRWMFRRQQVATGAGAMKPAPSIPGRMDTLSGIPSRQRSDSNSVATSSGGMNGGIAGWTRLDYAVESSASRDFEVPTVGTTFRSRTGNAIPATSALKLGLAGTFALDLPSRPRGATRRRESMLASYGSKPLAKMRSTTSNRAGTTRRGCAGSLLAMQSVAA